MPIRGDRLRWPPRPGKKLTEATGTRRVLSTDEARVMRQPHERDQSTDRAQASRPLIKQAHDDLEHGREDTDCRNEAAEIVESANATSAANAATPKR